jgi:hypothetical protein
MAAQDAQGPQDVQDIKARFTPEEWEMLISAPGWMAARMMLAAPSGLIGLSQEVRAAGEAMKTLIEHGSPNPLVNAVAAELKQGKTDEAKKKIEAATKDSNSAAEATARLWEQIRAADAVLSAKASPDDAAAYRAFLLDLGRQVAMAAKEGGGFFGGGTALSPQEQAALQEMETAFGAAPGGSDAGQGTAA